MNTAKKPNREEVIYKQYVSVLEVVSHLTHDLYAFTHAKAAIDRVHASIDLESNLTELHDEIERLLHISKIDFDKRR